MSQPAAPRNRLADEASPYLRQHAANPVDWLPWGEEAFARARAEDKPVFLSIGYSTCHWCHVMAHESFENPAIAALLNEHFVPVKVDREERPDVDRVYMAFVQATTGHGGWPMSVWLTPDLQPFYGGTYFPPEDRPGRAGFPTILSALAQVWRDERSRVLQQGAHATEVLRQIAAPAAASQTALEAGLIDRAFDTLSESFDADWGGFGGAPKFPQPAQLEFLWRVSAARDRGDSARAERARAMAATTLRQIVAGGIHDRLGGGFHRYSVDATWHVPHFEKMLYDQGQLACVLVEAYQLTGEETFAVAVRDTLAYVARDLTSPEGGFFSAEDADSRRSHDGDEHGEGAFYIWSAEEIRSALGSGRARVFIAHHGVEENGNAPAGSDPMGELAGRNILVARQSIAATAAALGMDEFAVAAILAESRATLFSARAKRPRPHRDEKILAAWNGLMVSGFARAGAAFDEPDWIAVAARAAGFIRDHLWDASLGLLRRSVCSGRAGSWGFAEDYAFLAQGLLDLYEASFDPRWLRWAVDVQASLDRLFWDEAGGGYFSSRGDDPSVLIRMKETYDGAEPAPGSVAALNLLRLGRMLGRDDRLDRMRRTLASAAGAASQAPHAMPFWLAAFSDAARPPRQIVLAGEPGEKSFDALAREVHRRFLPGTVVLAAPGGSAAEGEADGWLVAQAPWLREMRPVGPRAAAYVCQNFTCQLPVLDPAGLGRLLDGAAEAS